MCFVLCENLKCFSIPLSTTYITCPADPKKTLGIKLPFLVMIIKNLKKYFTFEVQVRSVQQGGPSKDQRGRCQGAHSLLLELVPDSMWSPQMILLSWPCDVSDLLLWQRQSSSQAHCCYS